MAKLWLKIAIFFATHRRLLRGGAVGIAVCAVVLGGVLIYRSYRGEQQRRILAELSLNSQQTLARGQQARLAAGAIYIDSLQTALQSERELSGELRAALLIHVPAQETTIVYRNVPTQVKNGERRANFRDSTFAGIISGTMLAPPYPAPLSLSYNILRPAFEPSVAFVQVGDSMVAVVDWRGEQIQIRAPYWKAEKPGRRKIQGFVDVNFTTEGWDTRTGPLVNLGENLQTQTWLGYDPSQPGLRAGIGLRGTF